MAGSHSGRLAILNPEYQLLDGAAEIGSRS
jgi:hypothetical protein